MATYSARPSPSAFSTPASTTLFRRLTWEGTVPLEIRVDSKELPANSDRGLECYYVQAPRVSYLPLLVPDLKRFLMDVVFDEAAARVVKEEEWWFESEDGQLLKWCVARSRMHLRLVRHAYAGCRFVVCMQALAHRPPL